jgi:type VI secretion system protein ImpA
MYLVQSLVGQDGMTGMRDGLQVIHGLISRYWDTVYPELDPDDDNDPTMRVNVLVTLCAASMLRKVREAPIVSHRALGRFSLRDVQVVTGQMALPEGRPAPDAASLDAAFMEVDLEELAATAGAVADSMAAVQEIEDEVTEKVGASQAPDLSALRDVLKEVKHELDQRLSRRGVTVDEAEEPGDPAASGGAGAAAGVAPQRMQGEITSREDVVRMLDKACQYFAKNEPTSPVPLILERAKRLIGKNFLEILRDMAPDGLHQAQNLAGVTDEG